MSKVSTPQKIYQRSESSTKVLCRTCAFLSEKRYATQMFSKSGKEKDLQEKCFRTCGIKIIESDTFPKIICRKRVAYHSKMWDFRNKTQQNQVVIRQTISVKRGITSSPSYKHAEKKRIWSTTVI